jgi:hypothetical protein
MRPEESGGEVSRGRCKPRRYQRINAVSVTFPPATEKDPRTERAEGRVREPSGACLGNALR